MFALLKITPEQLHLIIEVGLSMLLTGGAVQFVESMQANREEELSEFLAKVDPKDIHHA